MKVITEKELPEFKKGILENGIEQAMSMIHTLMELFGIEREVSGKATIKGKEWLVRMNTKEWHDEQRRKDLQMFLITAASEKEKVDYDLDIFTDEYMKRNDNF